jgi:hypothetical protein
VRERVFEKMGDLIATGQLDPDFTTNGVELASTAKTYSQLQSKYAMIDKAAMDARDNLSLALQSSSQVDRQGIKTDSQWLNEKIIPFLQGIAPNPGLSDFQTKLYTGLREYVKVANGSAASIAEPSNQAIKDATNMLNTAKASEDITATIKAINDDISVVEHNNKRMLEGTLNKIRNIGKGPGTPPPAPPVPPPPAPAPGGGADYTPPPDAGGPLPTGKAGTRVRMKSDHSKTTTLKTYGRIPAEWEPY